MDEKQNDTIPTNGSHSFDASKKFKRTPKPIDENQKPKKKPRGERLSIFCLKTMICSTPISMAYLVYNYPISWGGVILFGTWVSCLMWMTGVTTDVYNIWEDE